MILSYINTQYVMYLNTNIKIIYAITILTKMPRYASRKYKIKFYYLCDLLLIAF